MKLRPSNSKRINSLSILSLILICLPFFEVLTNEVIITDDLTEIQLGRHLEYFSDKSNQLTIKEVSSPEFNSIFKQGSVLFPNFGFQSNSFWVRLQFRNETSKLSKFYLEEAFPPIDKIELFFQDGSGFRKEISGDSLPFSEQLVRHRNPVFPIHIPTGSRASIYLKFTTKSVMTFRLSLFEEKAFYEKKSTEQFYYGIYYGVILILFITNLFLFFSIQEKLYLYYVFYTFSIGMYFLTYNGYLYSMELTKSSFWNDIANPLFMTLTLFSGTRTAVYFLNLREHAKFLKSFLDVLSFLTILNFPFVFLFSYQLCFNYLSILIIPIVLSIFIGSIRTLYLRNPLSWFFFLGFLGFTISGVLTALNNFGILENLASPNILQISSGFGTMVLSLGLGFRYFLLKQQNLEMEAKSILIHSKLNRIESELDISKKIHQSLLPSQLPTLLDANIYAKYLPSGEIGGDFYDFHCIDNKYLGIFIADVTGHGVPAALFASTVKFSFSKEIESLKHPSKLLANINKALFEKIGNNLLSAGYAYIDLENRRLKYASCGHPPLLIWKKEVKEFLELKPKGRLIGISPDIVLHDTVYKLEKGDRILIYTDGLIECENSEGIQFGEEALSLFTLRSEDKNITDFSNSLIETLNQYSVTTGRFEDDVTFIVLDIL